jgi:hypothetical protein
MAGPGAFRAVRHARSSATRPYPPKADKAWEARQEAARYRIFNAATNAVELTDEAEDENYFAVLDQAGNAAEAAAAEIAGYKTYADLLEALDTRRKQS